MNPSFSNSEANFFLGHPLDFPIIFIPTIKNITLPMVLKVWVMTKMLSMPIPRRRKGITAKGTRYRFHLCLGVCLIVPVCFVFCPCI